MAFNLTDRLGIHSGTCDYIAGDPPEFYRRPCQLIYGVSVQVLAGVS
jgi:hypothetical protein